MPIKHTLLLKIEFTFLNLKNKYPMRIISTFILSIVILQVATGQSVFPTYEDRPVWCISEFGFGTPRSTYTIELKADTTLCEKTYYPVWVKNAPQFGGETFSGNIGYLRIEDKKVWFNYGDCDFPETLLYDFNLTIGDTIYHQENSSMYGVVTKEDTIEYNGHLRRTLTIAYPSLFPIQRTWIEGIGDLFHPFNAHLCLDSSCEFTANILCFSDNNGVQYGTCTEPCAIDNTTTSIDNFQENTTQLSLAYNPVTTGSSLEVRYVFSKNQQGQFYVTNSLGQVLHQQHQQELLQEGNIRLNWSPQVSGMYWLVWQSDTGQRKAISFVVQ